jgi:membrane-bound serine protease (ClpP class)
MLMILLAATVLDAGPPPVDPPKAPVEKPALPVAQGTGPLITVSLVGGITKVAAEFLAEAIDHAREKQAQALIIRLDTPGGLLSATREIVAAFLNSDVPIVVWVGESGARAGSAGVFITMAAHIAAMAPGTNIGAAHPVSAFGKDIEGDMAKKVTNDTVAWARSIAQLRGRNADWAAEAVSESASIPEQEALEKNVVDLIARNEDVLIRSLHGRVVKLPERQTSLSTEAVVVIPYAMSARQKLVQFLANPNLAYILLLVGLFGLFLEFKAPGLMVPGVVGATCIAIVLGVQVMPVNWLGALLMAAAAVCLVAEVFVPSFGILTGVGMACLVIGSYLLFDVPESDFRVEPLLIWSGALGFALLAAVIGSLLVRSMRSPASTGKEAMVGEVGELVWPIVGDEAGRLDLRGTTWRAVSDRNITEGATVRVTSVEGITLSVVPQDEEPTKEDG